MSRKFRMTLSHEQTHLVSLWASKNEMYVQLASCLLDKTTTKLQNWNWLTRRWDEIKKFRRVGRLHYCKPAHHLGKSTRKWTDSEQWENLSLATRIDSLHMIPTMVASSSLPRRTRQENRHGWTQWLYLMVSKTKSTDISFQNMD